jgi:hypothetical protein
MIWVSRRRWKGIKGFPLIRVVGLYKIITHGGWIQKRNLAGEFLLYFVSPKGRPILPGNEEFLTKSADYNIKG